MSSSLSSHHFYPSFLYVFQITCCRKHFLSKMWPIHLASLHLSHQDIVSVSKARRSLSDPLHSTNSLITESIQKIWQQKPGDRKPEYHAKTRLNLVLTEVRICTRTCGKDSTIRDRKKGKSLRTTTSIHVIFYTPTSLVLVLIKYTQQRS